MHLGPAEATVAGTCPLCSSAVPVPPEPCTTRDVIAALESHFGNACSATAFTSPYAST